MSLCRQRDTYEISEFERVGGLEYADRETVEPGYTRKKRRFDVPTQSSSAATLAEDTILAPSRAPEQQYPYLGDRSNALLANDKVSLSPLPSHAPTRTSARAPILERPTTPTVIPIEPNPEIFISPHTARWLDDQQVQNTLDLGLNTWEDLQSMSKPGEAEAYALRMIDEEDEIMDEEQTRSEQTRLEQDQRGLSNDMQFLLGNGRFEIGENSIDAVILGKSAIIPAPPQPASEILRSRLRNTHTASSRTSSASSEASIDSLKLQPLARDDSEDDIVGVPEHRSKQEMTSFTLGFAIWCEAKGITRLDYASLREVLALNGDATELPARLSTLQSWARNRLPLPPLQRSKIPVKTEKMPSNTSGVTADMYHFDPRYLAAMLLSIKDRAKRLHFGMADILESATELWHSHCWGSSIRTCSADYARYPQDQSPIIPSDFVQYNGLDFARVFFFGRDRRPSSVTENSVLLFAQRVVMKSELDESNSREMILIEDDVVELKSKQVAYVEYISLQRTFEKAGLRKITAPVRLVYNRGRKMFRSVDQLTALKGELELEYYGRSRITEVLQARVTSLPFTCFIDDFGLYWNMYRSLTGIYLTASALTLQERQRTSNVFPITLEPHGSCLNDVVRALERGFQKLENGCRLRINGEIRIVWAPILAFTGDMKSQQEAAGFLGSTANLSCQMCYADQDTRDDMSLDTCLHGRYHHQTLYERARGASMNATQRTTHFRKHGLAAEPSALQAMTPALDLIVSRPGDPAHSEFAGIVRRIMPVLCKDILTKRALEDFTTQFRAFPFPPGWGRIQSPETHMKSWTMSECARASVIIPVLLRKWPLRLSYMRPEYKAALMAQKICTADRSANEWVVVFLARIAKSNSLIASTALSVQERAILPCTVLEARLGFQAMMNATVTVTRKKARQTKAAARKGKAQATISESESQFSAMASQASQATFNTVGPAPALPESAIEDKMAALPNVHAALHFSTLMTEYGLLWNVNALPGERMHKFFKAMVLSTNHRKVERQLLIKSCIQSTIRLALEGAFDVSDPDIASALQQLQQRCPKLFQDLVSSSLPAQTDDDNVFQQYIGGGRHVNPLVHGKISSQTIRTWKLPTKMSQIDITDGFFKGLQAALIQYGHKTFSLGSKPIYWYNQFSFRDPTCSNRTSLRLSDFICIRGVERSYAQILQIFTHCFDRDTERRIFLRVRRLRFVADEQDRLLNLPLLEPMEEQHTISMLEVCSKRVWIAPTRQGGAGSREQRMLLCNWDVQFS